jgi:hypothetical protein
MIVEIGSRTAISQVNFALLPPALQRLPNMAAD